ncbi:hypothetical protein CES85_5202 [Ochrobactrum quorumnocens]|uniref:Uncharacterized protein n=1 Tax=Ochrobactrum quorumnocens TaxID=271865 RepID=A0A248UCI3_9HYPH|nr:hypothetical protein CES85_5202 [[Ochrobactrum] quorumnocens]
MGRNLSRAAPKISGHSVKSAACYLTRWNAVIGDNIAL